MGSTAAFSPLNYAVLFLYMGGMLLVGWLFAGRQKTTEDYFLAGRKMPWLVVAMSMFASLTSAVTYMGLPATAYKESVALIVVALISPLLAPVLVFVFYPFYRRLKVTTSYEYIGLRFGRPAHFAVSGLFILARLGWLGTAVFAPALALSVVTGLPLWGAILLMGLVATLYTVLGGISADIWTDVVQFVIMAVGAVWLSIALVRGVPGGFREIMSVAESTGRLDIFSTELTPFRMTALAVGFSFFFQLMQDYGTDQTTVQRLMTISSDRGTMKAIFFNAVADFFFIGLLLFIGIGMLAYYTHFADAVPDGVGGDRLLPYYIIHSMPDGVSGLLITAIFAAAMSSMDSGVSSLATVLIKDFVQPLRRRERSDLHDLRLARFLTLVLGAAATGVAFYVSSFSHVIEAYTTVISLFSGPVLALFLGGILTRRTRFAGWVAGCCVAIPATLFIQYGLHVHWIYFFPFSFGTCFGTTLIVSLFLPVREPPAGLTLGSGCAAERT